MKNIEVLDCTLRDGGYVNEWNFGAEVIQKIITRLSEADMPIIECGFLSQGTWSHDIARFNTTELPKDLSRLFCENTLYVGMIALGEQELHYNQIPPRKYNTLGGIRITFHRDESEVHRAIEFANNLMEKGYKVFMQPIGTMFYSDMELLELIGKMNQLNPYAFYIVDTLGSMNSEMLLRLFFLINHNLNKEIQIGFHGHNNLQLAFSNAKTLIDLHTERNLIIDSSVFGMGRGAGNLCTELIAEYINSSYGYRYDCTKLFSIIDTCLLPIKQEFEWGYSAAFYISAVANCHPNYATYLMEKGTLLSTDIDKILKMIPVNRSYIFNEKLIHDLYLEYQKHYVDDENTIQDLSRQLKGKSILLIAPGYSILSAKETIDKISSQPNCLSISINFHDIYETDYVFFSNKKRFQYLGESKAKVIATSNLNLEDMSCFVVNYGSLLNHSKITYDNAGLMAIKLLLHLGVSEINLAGFDGFSQNNNHYDHRKKSRLEQVDIDIRNKEMQEMLKFYSTQAKISFVTQTSYKMEGIEEIQ